MCRQGLSHPLPPVWKPFLSRWIGDLGDGRRYPHPAQNPSHFDNLRASQYPPPVVFQIVDKIDKAVESKEKCVLIDKLGKYYHGTFVDSWVRVSGGKLRGKVVFLSEEKGQVELDANDILDIRPN